MSIDTFFLPAFLALGIVSTLSDFRFRRISNLWIIISLVYAIIGHLFLYLSGDHQETRWFFYYAVNTFVSTIVAIYFWKQNWWGGGDAKLFICYSLLIPFGHYPVVYFHYYFATFLLLMTTFIPAAIWTFFHAQINLIKEGKSIFYDFRPSRLRYRHMEFFQLSLSFIAIFFLSNLLILVLNQRFYSLRDFPIVIWILGIGFYKSVFRLFKGRSWLMIIVWILGLCVASFYPFSSKINLWQILGRSFLSWASMFILRFYILNTIDKYVERSKNENMAFAGWMFLGGLVIWVSKIFFRI